MTIWQWASVYLHCTWCIFPSTSQSSAKLTKLTFEPRRSPIYKVTTVFVVWKFWQNSVLKSLSNNKNTHCAREKARKMLGCSCSTLKIPSTSTLSKPWLLFLLQGHHALVASVHYRFATSNVGLMTLGADITRAHKISHVSDTSSTCKLPIGSPRCRQQLSNHVCAGINYP